VDEPPLAAKGGRDVRQLVRHIRDRDALADDSAVALALLIEGAPGNEGSPGNEGAPENAQLAAELFGDGVAAWPRSEAARAEATAEAARELRCYLDETPLPLPSAVWALGKTRDPSLVGTLASVLIRALDRRAEPLAYQALAALTTLPDDVVPVETIRLAEANGPDEVRELARGWLGLLGR
jgi:hypothetical protein